MSSLPLSALPALQPPHLAYDPGGRDRPARPRDPVPRAPRPLRSAREDHAVDAPPLALGVGDRRDRVRDALPPLRARLSQRVFERRRIAPSCAYGSWGGRRPSLAGYVTLTAPQQVATASGGRSCCLSSPASEPRDP